MQKSIITIVLHPPIHKPENMSQDIHDSRVKLRLGAKQSQKQPPKSSDLMTITAMFRATAKTASRSLDRRIRTATGGRATTTNGDSTLLTS